MIKLDVCVNSVFLRAKKWSNLPFDGNLKPYIGALLVLAFIPKYPILAAPYFLAMLCLLTRGAKILRRVTSLEFFDPDDATEDGRQREYSALSILWSIYSTLIAGATLFFSRSDIALSIMFTFGILIIAPLTLFCLSLSNSERKIVRVIKGRLLKTIACIISNYVGLFIILIIIFLLELVVSWMVFEVSSFLGIASSASAMQTSFSFLYDIDWKLWTPVVCYWTEEMAVPLFIFLSTTIAVLVLLVFLTPAYQLRETQTALSLTAGFSASLSIMALIWSFLFSDTISIYYTTLDFELFRSAFPDLPFAAIDLVEYGKQFDGRDFTGTVSNLMIVYTLGVFMARFLLEQRMTRNAQKAKRLAVEIAHIVDRQDGTNSGESKRSKIEVLYKKLKYRSVDLVILPKEVIRNFELE